MNDPDNSTKINSGSRKLLLCGDDASFVIARCWWYARQFLVIAHSAGCPLALSLLERLNSPIRKVILVAGRYLPTRENPDSQLILQSTYDWERIRRNVHEAFLINSDDDPWGCTDKQAYPVAQKLRATLIVAMNQGHMGSDTFEQPYTDFPLLVRLI